MDAFAEGGGGLSVGKLSKMLLLAGVNDKKTHTKNGV